MMHIPILTQLIELLSRSNHVTVYSLNGRNEDSYREIIGNAHVQYVDAAWNAPVARRVMALVRAFLTDHRRHPFILIHGFWGFPAGLAAVIAGKMCQLPAVVSFLGAESAALPQIRYGHLLRFRKRVLLRWISHNAFVIHLLSQFQATRLEHARIFPKRVSIIPFGVDVEAFRPRQGYTFPRPPFRILHVANLTEVKDQDTLLHSFKRILEYVPATLRVVGPDYLDGRLQRVAHNLGIASSVEFVGRVPQSEILRHYHWAHLLVHTSLHEAQSVAIVEAMASGVPVIGTSVGLLSDLAGDCVIAVKPRDHVMLAQEAVGLLRSPRRLGSLRRNGRKWAEMNSLSNTVARLMALYDDLTLRSNHVEAILDQDRGLPRACTPSR